MYASAWAVATHLNNSAGKVGEWSAVRMGETIRGQEPGKRKQTRVIYLLIVLSNCRAKYTAPSHTATLKCAVSTAASYMNTLNQSELSFDSC